MPPEYTFVPWLRQGLAAEIAEGDVLGADPDAGDPGRATMPVELTLATLPAGGGQPGAPQAVAREVSLLGPGDVGGIKAEAILRTHPADGSTGTTPGEFAQVEFYDEDFPWRYTPARAVGSRLRPWIALLVLTDVEFELREPHGALSVLTLAPRAVPPPVTETWAWAHAQLSRVVANAAAVDGEVRANPDHALSRLLSPRRLLPFTAYHAFLVPAFETGRLAGLGRDPSQVPAQRPAWGTPAHADDREMPVYHRFSFTTGEAADFESLARALVPRAAGEEFGKRDMDVADPGFGMSHRPGTVIGLEGALAPPDFPRVPFARADPIPQEVGGIVDAPEQRRTDGAVGDDPQVPDDPLVVPPAYGRWHAGRPTVADATGDLTWLAELNLDLRSRAAAGLGAAIVRERDEEYVQRAWEQVGEVEAANQRLREAELARGAAEAIMRKHVVQAGGEDRVLVLTSAAHAGLPLAAATQTVRGAIAESPVPVAAQAPAFRRITRPERPLMKRLTGGSGLEDLARFQSGLLSGMNAEPEHALSTAPPAPDPAAGVAIDQVRAAVSDAVGELQGKEERADRVFMELTQLELAQLLADDPALNLETYLEQDLRDAVAARADVRFSAGTGGPEVALRDRVKALAQAISELHRDGPSGAIVHVQKLPFETEFGESVVGKSLAGLTVRNQSPEPGVTNVAPVADLADVQAFASSLNTFANDLTIGRADPSPPQPLQGLGAIAGGVLHALAPARTIGDRVAATLPVIAGRTGADPRRLAPVMAHPEFRDPLFEPLRRLSQDYVIPNVSDLPPDTLTLMEPNHRFIEALLAGANHALAQELLWREYPTDQRGTYFKVFWDTRDAVDHDGRDDIPAIDGWTGDLGAQSALPAGVLVLVIRGRLLLRYPSTVVYAQEARFAGGDPSRPRELDPAGAVLHPALHARLDPDITLAGFQLSRKAARGRRPQDPGTDPVSPGYFFVLMERPGEPRFGLDDETPATGLQTWNDLAWDALQFPADTPNVEVVANAALAPAAAQPATWGDTAADMAAILFQSPVLLARHASEMLP